MSAFGINITVDQVKQAQTIGTHVLSNGKELKFINGYSPVFDLDNICEVLGLVLFPGLGKQGWEDFFSYAMGPADSRAVRKQLAEQGYNLDLIEEVRDYIFRQPKYQYARREWTMQVLVNTFGA